MLLRTKALLAALVFAAGFGTCKFIDRALADRAQVKTIEHTKVVVQNDQTAAAAAYKELDHEKSENAALRRDLLAGRKRMHVAVHCPSPETGGVDDEATYAELDPAAASDLVGITDEGDEAIRQLNALQDYIERE